VTTQRLTPTLALVVVAAVAATVAGCGLPANPKRPHLLTFADLAVLADAIEADPTNAPATFADGAGIPGGLPVSNFVTKDDQGLYHLVPRNTWTESYRSAYETAEVWTGFDEVWVQPVYVAITRFLNGEPQLLVDPDPAKQGWSPIFSVGPDSAFYSPFWQVFYFVVPDGTDPDEYKSARAVIDSGLPLIPGPAHTMSIVPTDKIVPAKTVVDTQEIGGPTGVSGGYLDGNDVKFLDFGQNNFSWNDDLVVEETPLFVFLYRDDATGELLPTGVPTVAGTGPLYANRPANVTNTDPPIPHYGAYWRLYTVELPPTARIFAPADLYPKESAAYAGPVSTVYGPTVIDGGVESSNQYVGRVALNASDTPGVGCFADVNYLDELGNGKCRWLDSQTKIEATVPPSGIRKTDITVTCPFISYDDKAFVVAP
jgi:hypothetical protein